MGHKAADARDLFRRMVFNILVPSITRANVGTDFRLAMEVGERGREATIENALSSSAKFGVTRKVAKQTVDELIEIVRGWRDLFDRFGVSSSDIDALAPAISLELRMEGLVVQSGERRGARYRVRG